MTREMMGFDSSVSQSKLTFGLRDFLLSLFKLVIRIFQVNHIALNSLKKFERIIVTVL